MKTTASYIRFNYTVAPYIWLRVPRWLAIRASKTDMFIDTQLGRKRK